MGASVSVVPDQTLTKEQAKELAGDKFDEALFDEYADADGLVSGQAFKEAAKITWSVNDRSPSRDLAQSLQELRTKQPELVDVPEMRYTVDDGVAVVSLGGAGKGVTAWNTKEKEHRLRPGSVLALKLVLDRVERDPAVSAVVVSAEGFYWCNGFDTNWIAKIHFESSVQI